MHAYPYSFKIGSLLFYTHLFILLGTEDHTAGIALIGRAAEWGLLRIFEADAKLTHVPRQCCPTSKSAQCSKSMVREEQTGSVTSRQLDQFGVGANRHVAETRRSSTCEGIEA
jgi:hypothetical protein